MFCKNCGTQLPDDADFCSKCGKPQREGVQREQITYETCRIEATTSKRFSFGRGYYTEIAVEAIGPYGTRILEKAEYNDTDKGYIETRPAAAKAIVDDFVNRLVRAGWEHTGVGSNWWQHAFRRPYRGVRLSDSLGVIM